MNKYLFITAIVIFGSAFDAAYAEIMDVELGWGNITPCSRVIWRNNGLLGTPSPTVQTAEQRVYAYATVDVPSVTGVQNDIQQCAVQGAGAAGVTAIIESPANAMPAFQAQFQSCLESRAVSYLGLQLRLSDSQCMW